MAIVFSLVCALSYGAADFCGGLASRRAPTLGVVVVSQAVGIVVLLATLPWLGGAATSGDISWGVGCGVAGGAAIALLYRGLAVGAMGVVSPITAVLAAVIPVAFGVVARGEHPATLAMAGIGAALVAVVCVSMSPGEKSTAGLPEALAAGVLFGVFFIALAQTRPASGIVPLVGARIASVTLLVAGGVLGGRVAQLRVPRASLALAAGGGILDMSANVFYVLAVHTGMLAIVAVLSSLYPASTVALAAIVLSERLVPVQWLGVALALAGVIAISAAR